MGKINILKEVRHYLDVRTKMQNILTIGDKTSDSIVAQIEESFNNGQADKIAGLIGYLNCFCLNSSKRFNRLKFRIVENKVTKLHGLELFNKLVKAGLVEYDRLPKETAKEKVFGLAISDIRKITDEIAKIYPGSLK